MGQRGTIFTSLAMAAQLALAPVAAKADKLQLPDDNSAFTPQNMDACLAQLAQGSRSGHVTQGALNSIENEILGHGKDIHDPHIAYSYTDTSQLHCDIHYKDNSCDFSLPTGAGLTSVIIESDRLAIQLGYSDSFTWVNIQKNGAVTRVKTFGRGLDKEYGTGTSLNDVNELSPSDRAFIQRMLFYGKTACSPAAS